MVLALNEFISGLSNEIYPNDILRHLSARHSCTHYRISNCASLVGAKNNDSNLELFTCWVREIVSQLTTSYTVVINLTHLQANHFKIHFIWAHAITQCLSSARAFFFQELLSNPHIFRRCRFTFVFHLLCLRLQNIARMYSLCDSTCILHIQINFPCIPSSTYLFAFGRYHGLPIAVIPALLRLYVAACCICSPPPPPRHNASLLSLKLKLTYSCYSLMATS